MINVKDLFRRSKEMEKEREKEQKSEPMKAGGKKDNKERRCTLLVESVLESARMQSVMVIGRIHGRVREEDTMYLYQPGKPAKKVQVIGIELGPREIVETAKNQQVGLCLDIEDADEVSLFAVLSNVAPVEGERAERVIENPRLFGLMMEYERLYQNAAYMDALLYELCYAKLLVPLYMSCPPVPQEDGTLAFPENAQPGFKAIKMKGDDSRTVFPAFTDEVATMAWKDAFSEGQPKQFATMQLPHLMHYANQGHAGFAINPFGPVPVFFPNELLERVLKSEVFMNRFGNPAAAPKKEEAVQE